MFAFCTQSAQAISLRDIFKKKDNKQKVEEVVIENKDNQKAKVFSIEDCVNYAIDNDPNIKVAAHTFEAHKSKVGQAKSNYFPTISASTSYNYQHSNSQGFSGGSSWYNGSRSNSSDYYQLNTSVNQLIWDFGKTFAGINMQKYNQESSGYDLDNAILNRTYQVKIAYFAVLAALANVDIFERSVRTSKK